MYNKNRVISGLFGLVGFRQFTNLTFPETIDAALLESRSGLIVEDEQPLLTPENIWHAKPETKTINDFLTEVVNSSINKLLRTVFTEKKTNKITKSIFESRNLFKGSGTFTDLVTKQGRFVGFEITPHYFKNIVVKINRIGLQFTEAQTALPLYVFHASKTDAVNSEPVTTPVPVSFFWHTPSQEIILEFDNHTLQAGGSYYLGYFEDDITGQAINRQIDYRQERPCLTCRNYEYESLALYSKFFTISPIEVKSEYLNGSGMFEVDKVIYSGSTNYGLNLSVSAYCDLSRFIIENEDVLADALAKQISKDLLEKLAYNLESSEIAERLRQNAMVALDDDNNQNQGVRSEYRDLVEGLSFDYSDLDTPCLPCNNKNGIKFSSL